MVYVTHVIHLVENGKNQLIDCATLLTPVAYPRLVYPSILVWKTGGRKYKLDLTHCKSNSLIKAVIIKKPK